MNEPVGERSRKSIQGRGERKSKDLRQERVFEERKVGQSGYSMVSKENRCGNEFVSVGGS